MSAAGVIGFLLGILGYSYADLGWCGILWFGVVGAVFLALFLLTHARLHALLAVCLIAVSIGAARIEIAPRHIPDAFAPLLATHVRLEGRVVADPEMRETSQHVVVEVEREGVRTKVLASIAPFAEIRYGDSVRIEGKLETPQPFATDGGRVFAYDTYLAKDGIFVTMSRASIEIIAPRDGFSFFGVLYDGKRAFARALEMALPEPESALASGILVGGKQGLGTRLLDAFTAAGLLQIVVLSGYNVMIVAEGVRRSLFFLPRAASLSMGAVAVTLFVLAAGAGSSAVRAGIMALVALFARATGRTYDALRGLLAALVLMLLWNPLSLAFDPGLQLSLLATIGLILGTPLIEPRLAWIRSALLRDTVATTLAAQTAVLPLLLYQTGNLSIVSFLANVVILPAVPVAMACSFFAALVAIFMPALAPVMGFPAYAVLTYMVHVAEWAAALPLSHLTIPAFPFPAVLLAYGLLGWLVRKTKRAAETPRPAS